MAGCVGFLENQTPTATCASQSPFLYNTRVVLQAAVPCAQSGIPRVVGSYVSVRTIRNIMCQLPLLHLRTQTATTRPTAVVHICWMSDGGYATPVGVHEVDTTSAVFVRQSVKDRISFWVIFESLTSSSTYISHSYIHLDIHIQILPDRRYMHRAV